MHAPMADSAQIAERVRDGRLSENDAASAALERIRRLDDRPAIVSITVAATLAVSTNAHLSRLIFGASGSAPLGFRGGRKSHSVPPRHDGRSAIATLERRLANQSVLPRGVLFASTQLPPAVTKSATPATYIDAEVV